MDKLDETIKYLWNKYKKLHSKSWGENCLENITISRYIDGLIKEEDKGPVEKHLAECDSCLDLLLLHKKIKDDDTPVPSEVPEM